MMMEKFFLLKKAADIGSLKLYFGNFYILSMVSVKLL